MHCNDKTIVVIWYYKSTWEKVSDEYWISANEYDEEDSKERRGNAKGWRVEAEDFRVLP